MGRQAANQHFTHTFVSLRFSEKGSVIKERISRFVAKITNEDITHYRYELKQLCDDRQVDIEEALEAADDHEAHGHISAKYTNAPGAPRGNAQLQALQTDLDRIKRLVFDITYEERRIKNLERIADNIEADRVFDLTYTELAELGF